MSRSCRIAIAVVVVVMFLAGGYIWRTRSHRRTRVVSPPKPVVVLVDPGHPSESNGGRTPQHGTTELAINWQVALKLQKLLEKDSRIKVVRTRSTMNQYMRNRRRALLGNESDAAIAVHLHCDAGPSRGFTIYHPDRKGWSEGKTGPAPEVLESSKKAAFVINKGMAEVLHGSLRDRGVKGERFTRMGKIYGGLTTSVWSEVPTVTIEMVFLSNAHDAAFIKSRAGQDKMAEGIARGVKEFIAPQLKTTKRTDMHDDAR